MRETVVLVQQCILQIRAVASLLNQTLKDQVLLKVLKSSCIWALIIARHLSHRTRHCFLLSQIPQWSDGLARNIAVCSTVML